MSFSIGKREVGDGSPCFIVYEAGPTHDGLERAIDLSRLAAEAGADAVKFQIIDPDRLVADRKQLFSFDVLVDRAGRPHRDHFRAALRFAGAGAACRTTTGAS